MNRFFRYLLIFAFIFHVSFSTSWGAERTIQFVGLATSWINQLNLNKKNIENIVTRYSCTVAVLNMGTSVQQIVSIKFNTPFWAAATHLAVSTTAAAGVNPDFDDIYDAAVDPSMHAPATCASHPCVTTDIPQGGLYLATIASAPIPMKGNVGSLCAGTLTVKDKVAGTPGSVVAAGTLTYINEMAIIGGQYQSAVYFSGSLGASNQSPQARSDDPLYPSKHFDTDPDVITNPEPTLVYNMNTGCYANCFNNSVTGPISTLACAALCGRHFSGAREASTIGIVDDFSTGETAYVLKTANPLWAGGRVLEMILGPFDSICSGNKAYFDHGGRDLNHMDSLYWDLGWKGQISGNTGGFPKAVTFLPERLYCQHSHNNPPPFGYVSAGTPFTINGGMPF